MQIFCKKIYKNQLILDLSQPFFKKMRLHIIEILQFLKY